MSKRFIAFALQFGIIALAFPGSARAQTTSGLITGTITDSTGAVIPGAHIQLANQATGIQRSAVTDANGYYSIPELQPGVYDVTVNKEGFASQKLANVHLEVNQSEALNFKMGVTASTQTVQVNAEDWAVADCDCAHLARLWTPAAPGGELQILQRPAVCREGQGHRRAVYESTGARDGAVRG